MIIKIEKVSISHMSQLALGDTSEFSDVRTDLALAFNHINIKEDYKGGEVILKMFLIWRIAMRARDYGTHEDCQRMFKKTLDAVLTHKCKEEAFERLSELLGSEDLTKV